MRKALESQNITLNCGVCGGRHRLEIENVERGLLDAGWRAVCTNQGRLNLVCGFCRKNLRPKHNLKRAAAIATYVRRPVHLRRKKAAYFQAANY